MRYMKLIFCFKENVGQDNDTFYFFIDQVFIFYLVCLKNH